jgi:pimeloyl-ACP methyl ester carboxylesterase
MTQPQLLSRLAHDRTGEGEPVVLIHGIGHRRQAWDPVVDLLAERYDVIRLDLAGFGQSPAYAAGTAYTMENACADLAANFAEWGIERPHVVGNSLGGAISLELATRGLVSSATVLSPAGFFGRWDRALALFSLSLMKVGALLPDAILRQVAGTRVGRRLVGYSLYAHPERATAESTFGDTVSLKRSAAFFPTIKAGLRYEPDFSGIEVPVTVAWGTKDRLLPYRQSREAQRQLPAATHVPLPGCGHIPMLDDPELVVSVVDETLGRAAASEAA